MFLIADVSFPVGLQVNNFYMLHEKILSRHMCWYFNKGTAFLHRFNDGIQRLIESGLVDYWVNVSIKKDGTSYIRQIVRCLTIGYEKISHSLDAGAKYNKVVHAKYNHYLHIWRFIHSFKIWIDLNDYTFFALFSMNKSAIIAIHRHNSSCTPFNVRGSSWHYILYYIWISAFILNINLFPHDASCKISLGHIRDRDTKMSDIYAIAKVYSSTIKDSTNFTLIIVCSFYLGIIKIRCVELFVAKYR